MLAQVFPDSSLHFLRLTNKHWKAELVHWKSGAATDGDNKAIACASDSFIINAEENIINPE